MHKLLIVAIAALFAMAAPTAGAGEHGLVIKQSAFGVAETLDRLEGVFSKKGITVFARVDHAAGAMKVGATLRQTQVIIFGSPKMGTPLMQSNQSIGIDLPLKVLAWRDEGGKTWIAYNDPQYLATRHGITDRGKVFAKMAGALAKMTDAATKK